MDSDQRLLAVIVAGGKGIRAGFRKQYAMLGGEPVLIRSCRAVAASDLVTAVSVSVPEEDIEDVREMLEEYKVDKILNVIAGGRERQDTVRIALNTYKGQFDYVLVHDAARPLIDVDTIDEVIEKAFEKHAAIVAVPSKDTVKIIERGAMLIQSTPIRETVYLAQTPQVFDYGLLQAAHAMASKNGWLVTDDASAVEYTGENVAVIEGSYTNIKLTTKEDFMIAEAILAANEKNAE